MMQAPIATFLPGVTRGWKPLLAVVMALCASGALADDYTDVNQLTQTGQLTQALERAERYLADHPRDPQMRFLKGVIQTDAGQTADAMASFIALTQDYPELPEPHNNLAALYAAQGEIGKARESLEMAIRLNPDYATAHENLGDVYLRMAAQAYDKALRLDRANDTAAPKLRLVRTVLAPTPSPAVPAQSPR